MKEIATPMGDAIADVIEQTRKQGRKPGDRAAGRAGGDVRDGREAPAQEQHKCDHVTTFNMDEWADRRGNSMPGDQPGGFEYTMGQWLFNRLGKLTVPTQQRNFATKKNLPTYGEKIASLKRGGAMLVTVYGIGRTCHIAFWEPHLADGIPLDEWKRQTHRIGVSLHPLTIEQNSLHSFNSRFTLIPCWANTIGRGFFFRATGASAAPKGPIPNIARSGRA